MTAHTLTGTATDTMAAADTDTASINSTASADQRIVTRSLLANRIQWGSAVDFSVRGPLFSDDVAENSALVGGKVSPTAPITLSQIFSVEIPCRFTGCRIFKAPNATATTVPVKLWSGITTGTELAAESIGPWVVDDGGWWQVDFSPTVDLTPGVTYTVGYHAEDGIYAYSNWVFNAQDTVVWPIVARGLGDSSGVRFNGNATDTYLDTTITFPTAHNASAYYVDVQIEWDDPLPGFTPDYHDQWVVPHTRHAFPIGVFFADPPYLQDYYDMGVNTLVGGSPLVGAGQEYVDAMNDMGNTMDWWPYLAVADATSSFNPAASLVQLMTEEPDVAEQIVGYHLWDEPDMGGTYRSPEVMREWLDTIRLRDSTRQVTMNFGIWPARNQGFGWSPSGATPLQVNEYWRQWATLTDIMSLDDYQWYESWGMGNGGNGGGVWVYAAQVGKLRELCDDRKPLWAVIETTSRVSDAVPDPDQVLQSVWAALIAGATGIIFFDHRFPNDFVTQDNQHMLNNPPMLAAVTDLCTQLQTLGPVLLSPDLGLVTAYTTSNMTEGPLGGTFGVPLHYTTRSDGTYEYLFVQAIREGATTGTITIPTWASEVVDVIDEARTETVSVGGVITDSFAADYQYHLYRRTL